MAVKPEDRPKLIGLVVALVGVIAYVLIALVPKMTAKAAGAPTDTATPVTAASATAPAGGAPRPGGAGEASATLPDEDMAPIPPSPMRDSFTPPAAAIA